MNIDPDDEGFADDLEESPFTPEGATTTAVDQGYDDYATERPKRVCEEPMPIAKAVQSLNYLVGVDDPAKAKHPFHGKCKVCDKPLPDLWRTIDHPKTPGFFPVNCCDVCYEEAKVDQGRLKHNREMWQRICPTEFRDPWDNSKGSAALFKRVMDWGAQWDLSNKRAPKKGLIIHGPTDAAKTRVCWQLYRKLCEEGVSVLFIESIDLVEEMPKEAFTVAVLIIDDLGNEALDYKKEQRLLKLLRARAQWHRPYIITTQYAGKQLVEKFKQEATGAAAIRRIRGFCEDVEAKPTAYSRVAAA